MYIVDGEWMTNINEPVTLVNKDGHINNYVQVPFNLIMLYVYQHMLRRHMFSNFEGTSQVRECCIFCVGLVLQKIILTFKRMGNIADI